MGDIAKKLNLNYIDQVSYLEGMHRSGWSYVMLNLLTLQNNHGVLCDTYVDRSFLWGASTDVASYLPYRVPWVGFIHHTFDTTFSIYNNVTLLQNDNFLSSLPYCKGIFVFSTVAKDKWSEILSKMGYRIPVVSLIHPTQFVSTCFTMSKFEANGMKQIVQIGAWLRDNYAIYRLNNGKPTFNLGNGSLVHKAALIGPKMEHYYKPFDFFRHFRLPEWKVPDIVPPTLLAKRRHTVMGGAGHSSNFQSHRIPEILRADATTTTTITSINGELPEDVIATVDPTSDGMCRDICRDIMCRDSDFGLNKYVKGAIDLLSEIDASVITYLTMEDAEYDTLLSQNIVFLKLIDAAAVNTLQECIVRCTPIVVNPLPAIVEVLGEGYPLYYENMDDVPALITLDNITSAYNYLVNMDKDALRIESFMKSIVTSEIYEAITI